MRRPDESHGSMSMENCLWTIFWTYMKDAKANCNKASKSWDTFWCDSLIQGKGKIIYRNYKKNFATLFLIQIKIPNVKINILCLHVCRLYFESVDEYRCLKTGTSNRSVQTSRYSSREYYFPQSSKREDTYLNILLTCEYRSLLLTIRQKIASWFNIMPHGI